MSSNLKILSFNVNGLGEIRKRTDTLDTLKRKNANIIMLQETHWTSDLEEQIAKEWGFDCIVNGSATNKNGVAILFCNNFEFTVHNIIRGNNGSFLILDITFLKKRLTLVNVYGPSGTDSPTFYEHLFNEIETLGNDDIIAAGDWNVVLNEKLDTFRYTSLNHKPKAKRKILDKMDSLNLIDIWRNVNPAKRQYSWRKFNTMKQGRLDFFLISETLVPQVENILIQTGYRSDHSIVNLTLKGHVFRRDKPLWKFNNSLLKDIDYLQEVKNIILKVKKQYGALVYDTENIKDVDNESLCLTINDQLFFEVLLMEIRGKSISYSSYKKREDNKQEKRLNDEISELENDLNDTNIYTLEAKKTELEALRKKTVDGLIIRARAQNIEEGEQNSKYFSNLEKRNYIEKSIYLLEREDNSVCTDPIQIKEETELFYKKLYSSKEGDLIDVDLDNIITDGPKLSDAEKQSLEGEITYKEALSALSNMQNDKSPGSSGFTNEFFKVFWKDIGQFLVRSINEGFRKGRLSVTQRQGVIICIPKEGKEKRFLKNWRPITLLNTSYKIASACIASRIKKVLPTIIHGDQTGFLAGRYIGENVRLIYDTLYHTEKHSIPGQILLVDFLKAFDSVSWSFIEKCLDFFNFGAMLKSWFKTFYSDLLSCVNINGGYTKWFEIQRGCRQGDPCSPYIFLICAEILSLLIRSNKDIKGIKINEDLMLLLSQFADDTSLFLDGSKKSFEATIGTLLFFASFSGLDMNLDKTQIVWIGSCKNSNVRYMPHLNFVWNPAVFKALGICFSTDLSTIVDLNFEGKLNEIRRIFNLWSRRYLTPYGKIKVIKTHALSKIVYLLINIPDPHLAFTQELDRMLYAFLWDNKPSKISRQTLCSAYDEGGLNMIDLYSFIASMKISWIKRVSLYENTTAKMFRATFISPSDMQKMGGNLVDTLVHRNQNPFWKDVFKHYKYFYQKCTPTNAAEFGAECIHYNANIMRGRYIIHTQSLIQNNILYVKDISNANNGHILSFEEFRNKYPNTGTNFLTYNGIKSAVMSYRLKLKVEVSGAVPVEKPKAWATLLKCNNSKTVYNTLSINKADPTCIRRWETIFAGHNLNWKRIFLNMYNIKDSHLRWFEIRIVHRIIPTQKLLHSMGLVISPICDFCEDEVETIMHLFWECPQSRSFWNYLSMWISGSCVHLAGLKLNVFSVLFLEIDALDPTLHLIIALAKYYIFNCKTNRCPPSLQAFKRIIVQRYHVEKNRNQMNSAHSENVFEGLWEKYRALL